MGAGAGSGVWYGISIQLSSSRSKTWTFTPLARATSARQAGIMWERGRMGGAGKKPTGWESDLPRASQSVGGRSSFTDPGRDVLNQEGPGMSELSLFL